MAFTTAYDWLERYAATGCQVQVDLGTMYPREDERMTPAALALWTEIQGPENADKWQVVEAEVRRRVGPILGWEYYPKR